MPMYHGPYSAPSRTAYMPKAHMPYGPTGPTHSEGYYGVPMPEPGQTCYRGYGHTSFAAETGAHGVHEVHGALAGSYYTSLEDLKGKEAFTRRCSPGSTTSTHSTRSMNKFELRAALREATAEVSKDLTQEVRAKLEPTVEG